MFKTISRKVQNASRQRTWQVLGGIVIILIIFALIRIILSSGDAEIEPPTPRTVSLGAVSELSVNADALNAIGVVKASGEAELRAETAGTVTSVSYPAGSFVPAGSIIATIENSAQQASVAQARARLASAEANLAKIIAGTRDEQLAVLEAGTISAQAGIDSAIDSALVTLADSYATTETALPLGVDEMISDAERQNPILVFNTSDSQLGFSISNVRVALQGIIDEHRALNATALATKDANTILAAIDDVQADLQEIRAFIDLVLIAIDKAIPSESVSSSDITGFETTAQAARASVVGSISALNSARTSITTAQASLTSAQQQQQEGVTGARSEDIQAAEAATEEAEAGLAASIAALEKTFIRTPISGTVTTLAIERGAFVSAFEAVGIVANENALEIVVFVPASDRDDVSVGTQALVDDQFDAVVTRVSPGLDLNRRQIEVKIGLTDADASDVLTNGESVSVAIDRALGMTGSIEVVLPVAAIKFIGDEAFVFTIDEDMKLVLNQIELGPIVGRNITVIGGVEAATEIVTDARGLSEGDTVVVQE